MFLYSPTDLDVVPRFYSLIHRKIAQTRSQAFCDVLHAVDAPVAMIDSQRLGEGPTGAYAGLHAILIKSGFTFVLILIFIGFKFGGSFDSFLPKISFAAIKDHYMYQKRIETSPSRNFEKSKLAILRGATACKHSDYMRCQLCSSLFFLLF